MHFGNEALVQWSLTARKMVAQTLSGADWHPHDAIVVIDG